MNKCVCIICGENSVLTSHQVSALPPEVVNVNRTAGSGEYVCGGSCKLCCRTTMLQYPD